MYCCILSAASHLTSCQGTRLYMSIELLVALFTLTTEMHPWRENYKDLKHEVQHDLEVFYMVVLFLCLLYEWPHAWKDLGNYVTPGTSLLPEKDILPLCAILWLSGQEQLNLTNIRLCFLALCTGPGFAVMVVPHFLEYFAPMAPYLEQICALLCGTLMACTNALLLFPTTKIFGRSFSRPWRPYLKPLVCSLGLWNLPRIFIARSPLRVSGLATNRL